MEELDEQSNWNWSLKNWLLTWWGVTERKEAKAAPGLSHCMMAMLDREEQEADQPRGDPGQHMNERN